MMFLEEPGDAPNIPIVSSGLSAGVSVSAALVLFLGIQPQLFLQLAEYAAAVVR
jgi:NADH:ubiquinone oxidoreductase subunit 2 (subunit N)